MKIKIIILLMLSGFAYFVPFFAAGGGVQKNTEIVSENAEKAVAQSTEVKQEQNLSKDGETSVRILNNGSVTESDMYTYLCGVVAAEMPASFEPEALKAQAVAARTYTLYRRDVTGNDNHTDADVCTDPCCCKAYADTETLKAKWREDYEAYYGKICAAVSETDGQYLTYENEPILSAFHSSSNGYTASSEEVWGGSLPYLVSVDSPETSETVPGFESETEISLSDFAETISAEYPEADFSGEPSEWITETEYTAGGRLVSVSCGGTKVSGVKLRSLFSLRSAAIRIEVGSTVRLMTEGYGHGVGMSQYGASIMAKDGMKYDEILAHYYPGTSLSGK